jgi:hypothetical protein
VSDTATQPRKYRNGPAAVALKLGGASFTEIAEVLDLEHADRARSLVESELASRSYDVESREILRREASARLERLLKSVWIKATSPDNPEHLPAIKVAVAVLDRHIRLNGLDAPAEVVLHTPTVAEIDQWVASLAGDSIAELEAMEANVIDVHELGPAPD